MATTPNRGYQLPAPGSKLKDDVLRLIAALGAIDTDVAGLLTALAGKSDLGHGHAMAEIAGLVAALGNKLDVGYHDALANLTDVDVDGVANGMALLRQASKWIPVALQINNIAGLETALNTKATPADITAAINALVAAAPGTLDTLNELATALGNDPDFATTITNALAGKQPLDSDLTAIAALTTTTFGRALLTAADAAALRTAANAASADAAIRDDIDQSAQSKASGLKINILKNTLQAWEQIGPKVSGAIDQADLIYNVTGYNDIRYRGDISVQTNSNNVVLEFSADGGATWLSNPGLVSKNTEYIASGGGGTALTSSFEASYCRLNNGMDVGSSRPMSLYGNICGLNVARIKTFFHKSYWINGADSSYGSADYKGKIEPTGVPVINALRFRALTGLVTVHSFFMEGSR